MSQDIRSYFSIGAAKARPGKISDDGTSKSKVNGKSEKSFKKKKTIIIDSDDEEDPLPPSPKRKKPTIVSDSKKDSSKASAQNLKPVNIGDIFGKKPVQRTDSILQKTKVSGRSPKKEESKRPAKAVEVISDSSDDEFAKSSRHSQPTAFGMDKKLSEKHLERTKGEEVKKESLIAVTSPKKEASKGPQRLIQKVELLSDSSSDDESAKSSKKVLGSSLNKDASAVKKEVSSPTSSVPKKGEIKGVRRTADYLSMSSSDDESSARGSGTKGGQSKDKQSPAMKGNGERSEAASRSPLAKVKESNEAAKRSHLESPLQRKVGHHKGSVKDVAHDQKTTPRQRKRSVGSEEGDHYSASKGDEMDESEKKKQRAFQYQRYLHREGPRNPGSKEVPKGSPNCLAGMTFVISGVLDSLDREEAMALVQQCGGKVTSNVSKNTTYIVLGDEPGPAKVTKARNLGTKELTEDGLLDLVRTKTKELEGTSPSALGKRTIKEEEGELELRSSPAKRQKMNVEELVEQKKPSLAKKLTYMSQNYDPPKVNVAKGSLVASVKSEEKSSSRTQVEDSQTGVSSSALQVKASDTMWVDKYKPTSIKQVIGQQGEKSNVNKLLRWLSNWQKYHGPHGKRPPRPGPWDKNDDGGFYKAALLSGAPGIGKTTSALLVCKELGMDAIEFNASDTRSKKLLESEVSELICSNSLSGYFKAGKKKEEGKRKVLVMDEVDGMAGNEDRGGVAALIQLIKESRIPVICICNDRAHPKIRSLVNHCYDLRFQRPRMEQIRGAMMSICFKEGVKLAPEALANLITSTNQDIRQVLHQLNMWSADKNTTKTDGSPSSKRKQTLKDVRLGPWDVLRKVFSAEERRNTTINQQAELFFYDYNLGPLFVFENYPKVSPKSARNLKERLSLLAQTTESLAMGDIIQKVIRTNNAWKLLPSQAIFSSVVPGALMEGHMTGQIDFPAFLGKTSTKGKMERLAQELSLHTRVTTRATKQSIKLDYLSYLRDAIISPLIQETKDQSRGESSGVHIKEALDVMQGYSLLREDLDSIMELTNFPGRPDPMALVSSKVKAAFTRAYNKEGIMTPYAVTMAVKKKRGGGGSSEDYYGEEGEGEEGLEDADEEEQEEDIDSDAMIKLKKPSARGQCSSKGDSGRSSGKDTVAEGGKGKGRGKGASGGRGGKKRS
ncbi:replication factor C subunit 1 isoform X2 [Ischnura elegans]|uniref:replication factor C subunit 1 isoform X2 n=1 Tax=Ischnura elegans TaxID=197161 RepID=UPI001ED8AF3B|nr:replication factor C subunit 1 isoform X2 [Ischnura elegans]